MTTTPAELRELANGLQSADEHGAWWADMDKCVGALRACADMIERSPRVTDAVVTKACEAERDFVCSHGGMRKLNADYMRAALEAVWPVAKTTDESTRTATDAFMRSCMDRDGTAPKYKTAFGAMRAALEFVQPVSIEKLRELIEKWRRDESIEPDWRAACEDCAGELEAIIGSEK